MEIKYEQDVEWVRDKFKWRGFRYLLYSYWSRKSFIKGTSYFTRTYFWEVPRVRSTYMEGFDDGKYRSDNYPRKS